jgi:hypothetical protein
MKRTSITALALSALALGAVVNNGCTERKQLGGLMLAISTDMAAPKDVDTVGLYVVSSAGVTVFGQTFGVTPTGEVRFPSTITLQEPQDPNTVFRVRVVAYNRDGKAIVLRAVTTKIPQGQFRQLRIPLSFLSYGSAKGDGDLVTKNVTSSVCSLENGETDVAGVCTKLEFLDVNALEKYDERTIFGGGSAPKLDGKGNVETPSDGNCFNVEKCFAAGTATLLEPDAQCTVRNLGSRVSIALSTNSIGVETPAYKDLVVLDMDAIPAFGEVGPVLTDDKARFKLPDIVCKRLKAEEPEKILEIFGSTQCEPKSRTVPLCGKASATQTELPAGGVSPDGGPIVVTDGGVDAAPPEPPPIEVADMGLAQPAAMVSFENDVYVGTGTGAVRLVSSVPAVTKLTQAIAMRTAPIKAITVGRRGGGRILTAMDFGIDVSGTTVATYQSVSLDGLANRSAQLFSYVNGNAATIEPVGAVSLDEYVLLAGGIGPNGYYANDDGNGIFDTPPTYSYVALIGQRMTAIGTYAGQFRTDVMLGLGRGESPTRINGSIVQCVGRDCQPASRTTVVPQRAPGGYIATIASLGTRMFYAWAPDDNGPTAAVSVWRGSGAPTDLATGLTLPKNTSIATDGKNVYYASANVVYAVPITGGTPVRIAPRTGSYTEGVGRVTVTGTHVYWITGPESAAGTVYRRLLE